VSPLLRFLTQRVGTAKARVRHGLKTRHAKSWEQPEDGDHSERARFHYGLARQIAKYRSAVAMREEFRRLRGAK